MVNRALATVLIFVLVAAPAISRARAEDDNAAPTTQPAELDTSASQYPSDAPDAPTRGGPLSLDELSLNLQIEGEFERRRVSTQNNGLGRPGFSQRNDLQRLYETLGLEARGAAFGDRVLTYDIALRGGLTQERYEESRPFFNLDESPNGSITEYDMRFQLFPAGKLSLTTYASQLRDRIPRPFLPSLDRRRERYGASLFYNDPKLPMELTFEHLFDDVTSGSRTLIDSEERGEDRVRYEATWQPTEYNSLRFEYMYERRDEQYSGTDTRFNTTRNYATLNHALQFGEKKRHRLDSLLRIEDEEGDLARDAFELSTRLRLQHTDQLFTTYGVQMLQEEFFALESKVVRGDWGLTHQYRDFLTTTLNLYALNQESNANADFLEFGSLIDVAFQKPNAWGQFSGNVSLQHTESQSSDGRRDGVVVGESVTFRDPLPAYLARRNVNAATIVVTDATRLRVFLPLRDFIVQQIGDETILWRIPTGAIADRQTVVVSYTYRSLEGIDVQRNRADLRLRQRFRNDLELYYAMSLQMEDLDRERFLTYRERDIQRHRLGLLYRKPRGSAGLELEFNDDSIDPYYATHANADRVLVQSAKHLLNGQATASFFRFDGEALLGRRDTVLLDLGLDYRYTLGPRWEANAKALYRYEDDSLFGVTNGIDLSANVAYKIGLFSLLAEVEYDALDLPSSTDNTLSVWFKVRRDIPVIGGASRR